MSPQLRATEIPFAKPADGGVGVAVRDFRRIDDGRFIMALPEVGLEFEIDRLRRKWDDLVGELTVRCTLAGASTFKGALSVDDLNLSAPKARHERSRLLADKSRAREIPWADLLDEFVQRVRLADREGRPAVLLRDLARPDADQGFEVEGFPLLRRHPVIVFGDGGAAKSYFGLYLAGHLERRGVPTLYLDYEFSGEDHRDRLERLFGPEDMPAVRYLRCDRPLITDTDHIRRIIRDQAIQYVIVDSIAFACHDKPENADVAAAYLRSIRQFGVGTLNIAHITKGDDNEQKPFGSAFWHNGARSSWFAKRSAEAADGSEIVVGLFHRKSNVGPLRHATGFRFRFEADRTIVTHANLADVPALASDLPVAQRMRTLLRSGAMTIAAIADELGEKPNTITQTAKRGKGRSFTVLLGEDGIQRIGLLERQAS